MEIAEPVYFIGIGGMGMSALAFYLLEKGIKVFGSDCKKSFLTEAMRKKGAKIFYSQDGSSLVTRGTVVYTSAVGADHPELLRARQRGLKVLHRSELLAQLTEQHPSICVTGSHGKSTLSGMLGWIFIHAELDPLLLAGAVLNNLGRNYSAGKKMLVCEADESDLSHLNLSPFYALVSNADTEHLNCYKTVRALVASFKRFCQKVPAEGKIFLCADDPRLKSLVFRKRWLYGKEGDYTYSHIETTPGGTTFLLARQGKFLGKVRLKLLGRHNVVNATGAAAVALEWGLRFREVKEGLASFSGMERRQQLLGKRKGVLVFDDYGHHPTEIAATLDALAVFQKPLVVIFQPHRYTRTKALLSCFPPAFKKAHRVILMPIYSAGEEEIPGLNEAFQETMRKALGRKVYPVSSCDEAVAQARLLVSSSGLVLTLGAGDVRECAYQFLSES